MPLVDLDKLDPGSQDYPTPRKPSKLVETGNLILDAIEPLNKPATALRVGAKYAWQGKPISEGLAKGWAQEEQASTQELLPKTYREKHPISSTTFGIAGDILTDPLTWIPGKALAAPFQAGKKVIGAATKTHVGGRAAKELEPLLEKFNVYTGDKRKAKEIYDRWRDYQHGAKMSSQEEARRLNQLIRSFADEASLDVEDLRRQITNAVETGDFHEGPIGALERRLVERNKEILDAELKAGVTIGDLGSTYMAHVATREARKAMAREKLRSWFANRPTLTHESALKRKMEGTVEEINAKLVHGTSNFFHNDPAIIQGVREFRHAHAMAGAKYLEDIKQFGVAAEDAPKGYVQVHGVDDVKFDPEMAKILEANYERVTSTQEIGKWLPIYDSALRWWKMWSLGARPAYHSRNVVGNLWNAYLGGLDNPLRYRDAAKLQAQARRGKFSGEIAGMPSEQVYQLARDHGVMGKGQYLADVENISAELGEQASKNPLTLSTRNPVLQAGFAAGGALENNARLALFIDRLTKGDEPLKAAQHMKKYLFDYGDLSPFEQNVMKRFIPFYTWSRKNIPLQLEALASQPDKIQKLNIARQNIEQDVERPDPRKVPDFIKALGPVYTGDLGPEKVAITLTNYHPLLDVGRLFSVEEDRMTLGGELAASMVSPYIKAPLEYVSNYDLYRQRAIKEYEGQTGDFLGIKMPIHLAHLAKSLVMLNEIDRANPLNVFGESKIDKQTKARTRSRAFGLSEPLEVDVPEDVPIIGGETFGIGASREARTDLPGMTRLAQYLSGFRPYAFDPSDNEKTKVLKLQRGLREILADINRAGMAKKTDEIIQLEKALKRQEKKIETLLKRG